MKGNLYIRQASVVRPRNEVEEERTSSQTIYVAGVSPA